jgi:hypothetical protein
LVAEAVPKLQIWNSFHRLRGKTGLDRFFQELVPKLTEFWNKLSYLQLLHSINGFAMRLSPPGPPNSV